MQANELRKLPQKELLLKAQELREKIFQLGFKATQDEGTNPSERSFLRRDVARVETILAEQKSGGRPKSARLSHEERKRKNERARRMKKVAKPVAKRAPLAEKKA